jgi:hypothetical protein
MTTRHDIERRHGLARAASLTMAAWRIRVRRGREEWRRRGDVAVTGAHACTSWSRPVPLPAFARCEGWSSLRIFILPEADQLWREEHVKARKSPACLRRTYVVNAPPGVPSLRVLNAPPCVPRLAPASDMPKIPMPHACTSPRASSASPLRKLVPALLARVRCVIYRRG